MIWYFTGPGLYRHAGGEPVIGVFGALALFSPLLIGFPLAWPTRAHRRAERVLAQAEGVGDIGCLIDALIHLPGFSRSDRAVMDRLIELLTRIGPGDQGILTVDQIGRLITYLWVDPVMVRRRRRQILALLGALEHIGDASCEAAVERLANIKVRDATTSEVRQAADACLASIRRKADADRLLRAAMPEQADLLLRPAGSRFVNPTNLLRPAGEDVPIAAEQLVSTADGR